MKLPWLQMCLEKFSVRPANRRDLLVTEVPESSIVLPSSHIKTSACLEILAESFSAQNSLCLAKSTNPEIRTLGVDRLQKLVSTTSPLLFGPRHVAKPMRVYVREQLATLPKECGKKNLFPH